jgi:signal transduction histidine kinase
MSAPAPTRLSVDELRTLFLFEGLTDEQLQWIADRGEVRTYDAGTTVYQEAEPADYLYILLNGELRMSRSVQGEDVTVVQTAHRGSYSGAMRAYIADGENTNRYLNSMATIEPSRFFLLSAADFAHLMREWFPMAVHLLDGLYLGIRNSEGTVRQREHLAKLGTLSAGLAHELNNPAAAAMRATAQLRDQVVRTRHKLKALADGRIEPALLSELVTLQETTVARVAEQRRQLSPVEVSDLEDELADRLDELGLNDSLDLAAGLAAAGLGADWVDEVVDSIGVEASGGAIRWLVNTLETEALMSEIEEAATRISKLVGAVKQYAYMDTASTQDIDVHVGLDSTLVILNHKLTGIEVHREYDRNVPKVPAHPAELNQVWTNLIDNAADAMGGTGVLTLRTSCTDDQLVVEVSDTGPGIPEKVLPRIFDAFYTTKAAGSGSGLGLENARRIVVKRHLGSLDVDTSPSGTTFRVRLPLHQQLR